MRIIQNQKLVFEVAGRCKPYETYIVRDGKDGLCKSWDEFKDGPLAFAKLWSKHNRIPLESVSIVTEYLVTETESLL